MVQKLDNKVIFLKSDSQQEKKQQSKKFELLFQEFNQKSVPELLEILSKEKSKDSRLLAVHLLGEKSSGSSEVLATLKRILSYEHSSIRKEVIWSLAKLDDKKILPILLELLSESKSEFEVNLTSRLLGKIGDERAILPLLKTCVNYKKLAGISAGASIHEIINRIGIHPLLRELQNENKLIRLETVWILSARANLFDNSKERKKIIIELKKALGDENDPSLKVALAYNLSLLNVRKGAEELLSLCLSDEIAKDRQPFFWEEIIRFYIYQQKQKSLDLITKIKEKISNQKDNDHSENPERVLKSSVQKNPQYQDLLKMVKQLEFTIVKLDKIFDFSN